MGFIPGRDLMVRSTTQRVRPRWAALFTCSCVLICTWAVLTTGCSSSATDAGPASLNGVEAAPENNTRERQTTSQASDSTAPSPVADPDPSANVDSGTVDAADADADDGDNGSVENTTVAQLVLARYDELVTSLAVDPALSSDPIQQVRTDFDRLVPPGSSLSGDVLSQLVTKPLANSTRLLPGPEGVSYRHHAIRATSTVDGSIDFTWCGYAPGVRVSTIDGSIVDDEVAHLRGIGVIRPEATGPTLYSFDQFDLSVLPPGSPDPCLIEVDEARRSDAPTHGAGGRK